MVSTEIEIRTASANFRAALKRMVKGEAGAMDGLWSHGAEVSALHPIGGRDIGCQAVGSSFGGVAGIAYAGDIRLTQQHIQAAGDMAWVRQLGGAAKSGP